MRIEEVSKKFDIPKSQIRYYEKIGLLYVPRDLNDYRNFDERSIIDLKMIIDLKSLDIDLSDIKYILELFHKTTNRTCNANSTEYIDKVIQNKEEELYNQVFILNKLKRIHNLAKNNQYELNKDEIFKELSKRRG